MLHFYPNIQFVCQTGTMDKLKGPGALNLVIKKFTDSSGVIRCILEFYKTMSQAEEAYATNICKVTKSGTQFRSTFIMKLLDMEPHHELQSLKQGWHSLGQQLERLAEHHKEKAKNYLNGLRQPLLELLPQLEEERKRLKARTVELTEKLEMAQKKHTAAKKRYFELGDKFQRVDQDLQRVRNTGTQKHVLQLETKRAQLMSDTRKQEERYLEAVTKLQEEHAKFDECAAELIKGIQSVEVKRIQTVADSIREFTKVLANTCPIYLEGMKRIYLSADEISAEMDVQGFAEEHKELMKDVLFPEFVPHQYMSQVKPSSEGTPPPAGDEGEESEESEQDETSTDSDSHHEQQQQPPPKRLTTSQPAVVMADGPTNGAVHFSEVEGTRQPEHPAEVAANGETVGAESQVQAELRQAKESDGQDHPSSPAALPPPKPKPLVKPKPTVSTPKTPSPSSSNTMPTQKMHSAAAVMKDPAVPATMAKGVAGNELDQLLACLLRQAGENDYYGLLGAAPSADESELARCRRERNQELHPDHFVNDPVGRRRSELQLSRINQAYTDVLKPEGTRKLYNSLCSFRKSYSKLIAKSPADLEVARDKLAQLHRSLKRSGVPTALLTEVDLALQLIHHRLQS